MSPPDAGPPACDHGGIAVAHAWHAAEPEDEQLVLEHLPGCPACRRVVDDALAVAAELALAVPTQDPPPDLRERIRTAALAEPSGPPRPVVGTSAAPAEAPERVRAMAPDDVAPAAPGQEPDAGTGVPRRALSSLVLLAAAVVLGVVLLAGQALLPGGAGTEVAAPGAPPDPASLAARAAQVVDDAESTDPTVRHAVLRDGDGRSVAVVLDGGAGRDPAVRVVDLALTDPPAGRSWVLWGTGRRTGPEALGALDRVSGRPAGPGPGARPPDDGWRGFAVSQEPSGTVPDRPSEVLALGTAV